jgi:hypothetical protein
VAKHAEIISVADAFDLNARVRRADYGYGIPTANDSSLIEINDLITKVDVLSASPLSFGDATARGTAGARGLPNVAMLGC